MNDMLKTIIPKSDQLNADDLIGGKSLTIKITGASIAMGDQPVALSYEGDGGKPYKPGKSMRRVLVNAWGPDANVYIGRYLTLYRDEKVKFGGIDVGGIRISHMSHIPESMTMALTVTKAQRKPFTVQPLNMHTAPAAAPAVSQEAKIDPVALKAEALKKAEAGKEKFIEYWRTLGRQQRDALKPHMDELQKIAEKNDDPFATSAPAAAPAPKLDTPDAAQKAAEDLLDQLGGMLPEDLQSAFDRGHGAEIVTALRGHGHGLIVEKFKDLNIKLPERKTA
jgi:hypothetical protein